MIAGAPLLTHQIQPASADAGFRRELGLFAYGGWPSCASIAAEIKEPARGSIDTPFVVLNADDFYGADAYRLAPGARGARHEPDYACPSWPVRGTMRFL